MVLDGILYAAALTLLGAGAAALGGIAWAVPAWALAAFVLYFFRDPERVIPAGPGIVSPADGRIVELRQMEVEGEPRWKISIFLSVFDVHVNRAPISGTICKQTYRPGRFRIASRPEASVENEQNTVTIAGENENVIFKQIAGAVARRIVFRKRVGERIERGERVGLIKFGSRVDLFIPLDFSPQVALGDRVRAGSSWIARPVTQRAAEDGEPSGATALSHAETHRR